MNLNRRDFLRAAAAGSLAAASPLWLPGKPDVEARPAANEVEESIRRDFEELIVPRGMIFLQDETDMWNDQGLIDLCGGTIAGAYIFDANLQVYCCSLSPSYEMEFVESVPLRLPDCPPGPSLSTMLGRMVEEFYERQRQEIYDRLLEADVDTPPVSYFSTGGQVGQALERPLDDHWDGKTLPCAIETQKPTREEWADVLDECDGSGEDAHRLFMDMLREDVSSTCHY